MPSKPQPKYHDIPDGGRFTWDKPERKEPRHKRYNRRCKCCGIYLTTPAEDKIGVHIRCVQEVRLKQAKMAPIMSRPRYGSSD